MFEYLYRKDARSVFQMEAETNYYCIINKIDSKLAIWIYEKLRQRFYPQVI